jgi:hypothetical protein
MGQTRIKALDVQQATQRRVELWDFNATIGTGVFEGLVCSKDWCVRDWWFVTRIQ